MSLTLSGNYWTAFFSGLHSVSSVCLCALVSYTECHGSVCVIVSLTPCVNGWSGSGLSYRHSMYNGVPKLVRVLH